MSPANMVLTPKRAANDLDLLKPHSVTSSFGENKGFVGVLSFAGSQPWFQWMLLCGSCYQGREDFTAL